MLRKIIKQGPESYTIYLPKKWCNQHNLKYGDQIEITEKDGLLIISAETNEKNKSKTITFTNSHPNLIRTAIASAYKAGFTEIIIQFKVKFSAQAVYQIVNTFTGLEIVSQKEHTFTLKSFLAGGEADIENLIIKMFQIVKTMLDEIMINPLNLDNLELTKKNVQKVRDHCLRLIHTHTYGGDLSYDYYDLVTQLEKVSSDLFSLSETVDQYKIKDTKMIKNLAERFSDLYHCFLKKEIIVANTLWTAQYQDKKNKIKVDSFKKNNPLLVSHYFLITNRFLQLASRIVSLSSK